MISPTKKDPRLVMTTTACGTMPMREGRRPYHLEGFDSPETWTILGVTLYYFGTLRLLAYPINYEITASALEIHSGLLMHQRIPLASIIGVRPSGNPLSPRVIFGQTESRLPEERALAICPSPREKEAFLHHLVNGGTGEREK